MSIKNIWNDVPQPVHSKVLETLDSLEDKKQTRVSMCRFYKAAVACLVIICVAGITACAAEAIHAYKERMTEMNRQLLEEYYTTSMLNTRETISYSRALTKEETKRYNALKEEYLTEGHFPKGTVKYLENASDYRGKGVALHAETGILYIPDKALKDEEILQIIDFFQKLHYSFYVLNEERLAAEHPWQERLQAMSDEEVDEIYINTSNGHVFGAYSRKLNADEEARYNELVQCYEKEKWIPTNEINIIEIPEEYNGETIAYCVENSTYYFPDRAVTDEEFLQMIDLNHKHSYCLHRIGEEIRMGFRTGYPGYPKTDVMD